MPRLPCAASPLPVVSERLGTLEVPTKFLGFPAPVLEILVKSASLLWTWVVAPGSIGGGGEGLGGTASSFWQLVALGLLTVSTSL